MKIFFKALFITVIFSLISSCDDVSYDPILPEKGGSTSAEVPKMGKVYAEQTSATTATVTWSATDDLTPQNELSYDIHLSQQPNFTPDATTRKTTVLGTTKTDLTNLETNKAYYILVIATDKNGFQSVEREYVSVVSSSNPKQPQFSGLNFSAPSDMDKATIAWQAATDDTTPANAIKYEIHLSQQENFEPTTKTLHSTAIGETQKVISGLSPATTYYATVIAVDQDANRSPIGETHKITTLSEPIIANPNVPFYNDQEIGLGNVSPNGTQYTFSKFNPSKLPVIGSVLFIHIGDEIHLRKVNALTPTSNSLIVETGDAALSDVLDQATIESTTTFKQTNSPLSSKSLQKSLKKTSVKPMNLSDFSVDLSKQCATYKDNFIEACWTLDFNPSLDFNFAWKNKKVTQGKVLLAGKLDGNIRISVDANGGNGISQPVEIPIYKKRGVRYYLLGGIPVAQVETYELKLKLTANALGKLKGETTINFSGNALVGTQFNLITQAWENISTPPNMEIWLTNSSGKAELESNIEADVRIIPSLSVKFYALAGPEISIEPFLKTTLSAEKAEPLSKIGLLPFQINQFDVKGGLEGKVKLVFGAFGNFPSLGDLTFIDLSKDLLSLPKLSATGGSGKVDESISVSGNATNGTNNKFSDSSIKWYVDPSASISGGKSGTLTAGKEGTYTVFFSGTGETTSGLRQYAWADVNVSKKDEEKPTQPTTNQPVTTGSGDVCMEKLKTWCESIPALWYPVTRQCQLIDFKGAFKNMSPKTAVQQCTSLGAISSETEESVSSLFFGLFGIIDCVCPSPK